MDAAAETETVACVARPDADLHSRRSVLLAVVRRSWRHVLEASVVPAVLFYVCLIAGGLPLAYVAALVYSYGLMAIHRLRGRSIPPLLVLTVLGLTVRTIVAVVSGSAFLYFVQPVLSTLGMSLVFLLSIVVGRPLIATLAHEFWPLTEEDEACPGVARHFRNLTVLWAGVNLVTALTTLTLLMVLPLSVFVAVKQFAGLAITAVGVFFTVSSSIRMARREGLASAYAPA